MDDAQLEAMTRVVLASRERLWTVLDVDDSSQSKASKLHYMISGEVWSYQYMVKKEYCSTNRT
jgi:hypothetical protein